MKLTINESNFITESANNTTLKDMNTDVIPVLDFGLYGGTLSVIYQDVFTYDSVDVSTLDPNDEYYDEIMSLVNDDYDGTDAFRAQVLRTAPKYIQQAFDEYGIAATVVADSCKWNHPRQYNYSDDVIEFDMTIDTNWVANKFRELSSESDFRRFIDDSYSSYDGFISYMPNTVDEFNELANPSDSEYWKLVSAIITYMVAENESIKNDIMGELEEWLVGNPDYESFSTFEIY